MKDVQLLGDDLARLNVLSRDSGPSFGRCEWYVSRQTVWPGELGVAWLICVG